jgi:hypothetical protein
MTVALVRMLTTARSRSANSDGSAPAKLSRSNHVSEARNDSGALRRKQKCRPLCARLTTPSDVALGPLPSTANMLVGPREPTRSARRRRTCPKPTSKLGVGAAEKTAEPISTERSSEPDAVRRFDSTRAPVG